MKRRITVEEFKRSYRNSGDGKASEPVEEWHIEEAVTGGEKTVAGFLRALADSIDPPKDYR